MSLSALSQVQKSNLLVTPLAPLGNFLNSSDLSYPRCPKSCGEGILLNSQLPAYQGGQWVKRVRAGLTTWARGGQCRALTVLMEMWLRAGGKGPFWVWWLMDGKGGGDQNSTAKTWTRPPKQGGRGRKGTGGHFLAEHCPPGWMRICRTSYTPIMHHLSLRATHLTNDEAKTQGVYRQGKMELGFSPAAWLAKP